MAEDEYQFKVQWWINGTWRECGAARYEQDALRLERALKFSHPHDRFRCLKRTLRYAETLVEAPDHG